MRKLFTLFLLLSTCIISNAQKIGFGVEVYGGLSGFYDKNSDITDFKHKLSYGGTILMDFEMKKKIYFETGIGYLNNGSKSSLSSIFTDSFGQVMSVEASSTTIQNYLTLPLNLRFLELGKNSKLSIITGFYYSFLLSKIIKTEGFLDNGEHEQIDERNNITDKLSSGERHDLGLNLELQRKFLFGDKYNISFGLYGKFGLLNTLEKTSYGHKNYSFGVKSIFRINKKTLPNKPS